MNRSGNDQFLTRACYPAVLLWTTLALAPMLRGGLMRDDFAFLGRIAARDSLREILLLPQLEHMLPLRQLLYFLQYRLFGTHEWGYQCVTLSLHLLAVALICRLAYVYFGERTVACATGLFFGVSSAHWITPTWLSTQGQLLAAVFLLLGLLSLEYWTQEGRWTGLLYYTAALTAMALSFSYGAEMILLTPLLVLLRSPQRHYYRAFAALVATVTALMLVFLLRSVHHESSSAIALSEIDVPLARVWHAVQVSVQAAVLQCGAAVTGVRAHDLFEGIRRMHWSLASAATTVLAFALLDWRRVDREGRLGELSLFYLSSLLFFFLPSLLRQEYAVYSRSWYAYLPQLFVSLAAGYALLRLRLPKSGICLILFAVSLSNAYFVRSKYDELLTRRWTARHRVDAFREGLAELRALERKVALLDSEYIFIRQLDRHWGLKASDLCAFYFPQSMCSDYVFYPRLNVVEPGVDYFYFDFRTASFRAIPTEGIPLLIP